MSAVRVIQPHVKAAVIGALLGDATALGYHWIYDTSTIPQGAQTPLLLEAPRAKWHNPNTPAGSFTHYGSQALVLLDSLRAPVGSPHPFEFSHERYWSAWKALWEPANPVGALLYRDGATKGTLANIIQSKQDDPRKCGSESRDFSVIGRCIAPLLLAFVPPAVLGNEVGAEPWRDREGGYVAACLEAASTTHTNALVLASVEFFARVLFLIVTSPSPQRSIADVMRSVLPTSSNQELRLAVAAGLSAADDVAADPTQVIAKFGPACGVEGALPSTVYLLARCGEFGEALRRNIAAGGDQAARGSVLGCILGGAAGDGLLAGETGDLWRQLRSQHALLAEVGL